MLCKNHINNTCGSLKSCNYKFIAILLLICRPLLRCQWHACRSHTNYRRRRQIVGFANLHSRYLCILKTYYPIIIHKTTQTHFNIQSNLLLLLSIYKSLNTKQTDWNMHCKAPVGLLSIPKFINIKFLLDRVVLISSQLLLSQNETNKIMLV